jgi:hypothetical protein
VAIGIAGVVLMLSFDRVDSGVFVEGRPADRGAPSAAVALLSADRFERLCKEWLA